MNSNAVTDQDAMFYYLYLDGNWAGPYQVSQIRELVADGTVLPDAIAYNAALQQHFMVEDLISQAAVVPPSQPQNNVGQAQSSQSHADQFDDVVEIAPEPPADFGHLVADLQQFYLEYLALTERTSKNFDQSANALREANTKILAALDRRHDDIPAFKRLVNEIDEVGDYLANRQQLMNLWSQLSDLEKINIESAPDDAHTAALAVLGSLYMRAEQVIQEHDNSSSVLLDLDGLDDDAQSIVTRKMLREVADTKRDFEELQARYNQAQEEHAKDIQRARKLLEKADAARIEERNLAIQTAAEVRNLAAEIHRLANEADVIGSDDQELIDQVMALGEELSSADISTLAYIAEDVLIRLINHLRELVTSGGGDSAPLREELALARESLAQAQERAAALEADNQALRKQYEEQRIAAERASELARDREHRLRSTVTALEVTKELHLEVMEDLKKQLSMAQSRVESMENDLHSVRVEMRDSTGSVEARGKAIQDEMERMVEMKAMLEVRSNELSASLKSAEDELAKAQLSNSDAPLAEALAAKVNALRQTFDATTRRLQEQEQHAERLTKELEASRIEAAELRTRSDSLSGELSDARSSLSASKRRLDELQEAYGQLEAEREALQTELHQRKQTDSISKSVDDNKATERITRLERDTVMLTKQLANEKRQVGALVEAKREAEARLQELLKERDELRERYEQLQKEHFEDHARHTSAIAVSTQAAIESERRLHELQERIKFLESETKKQKRKSGDGDALEPSTARVTSQSGGALESTTEDDLIAELAKTKQERDFVKAELETVRATQLDKTDTEFTSRMATIEEKLAKTRAQVLEIEERHSQAAAERDRVKRELERLKGEHEAAAVEHRAALKAARDRLVESQARVAELEAQISRRHQLDQEEDDSELRNQLDQSLSDQEQLSSEVRKLATELERINSGSPTDRDSHMIGLAKASQQLAAEQEKVLVLTRSLMETLQQADQARARTIELEGLVNSRTSERDRLQTDLDKLRAEISNVQLGNRDDDALRDAIAKRDQALTELEQTRQELDEVRGKLSDSFHKVSSLEELSSEQERIKALEGQIEALRADNSKYQQLLADAQARMAQAIAERDELAREVAVLRARNDHTVELKMLRRRLIRAKRIIKRMRRERDQALREREQSAVDLLELSGQLDRMKGTQRAVAEALGLPTNNLPQMPAESRTNMQGYEHISHSGYPTREHGGYPTRETALAWHQLPEPPPRHTVTRAITRHSRTSLPTHPSLGFVSAYGKPTVSIPAQPQANGDTVHPHPAQTHVTSVLGPKPPPPETLRQFAWRNRLVISALSVFGIGAFALLSMPPLVPIAMQAVVNSPVIGVKASIDGKFSSEHLQQGYAVDAGQIIGTISNDYVDVSTLRSLQAKKESVQIKIQEVDQLLSEQKKLLETLSDQIERYKTGFIVDLERRLQTEQEDIAKLEQELSAILDPKHTAGLTVALQAKRTNADNLSRRLSLLKSGQFDPADAPIAQAKYQTTSERIESLRQQRQDLLLEANQLDESIAKENDKVEALRRAQVVAPQPGVLWSPRVADGQLVKSNNELFQIADTRSMEIEALLPERYRFDIAMDSQIMIVTADGRYIRGTLNEPLVQGASSKSDRALKLPAPANGYDRMYITIDPTASPLNIGQKVKVVVQDREPGMISRALVWFYEKTRF